MRWLRNLIERCRESRVRKEARNHVRKGRRFSVELLEDRLLLSVAVDFVINSTYDPNGFFDAHPQAANVLQAAANDLTSRLTDNLAAIPAPTGANTWTAGFVNPGTGAAESIPNLQVPANTLIVYVGGRDLGQAGRADTSSSFSGDTAWIATVQGRGQPGALGPAASRTDVAPWGGSIAFDVDTNWFFGLDPAGITAGQLDFYTVAQHELGHLLGFTRGSTGQPSVFENNVTDNKFTGANAKAAFGNQPVPVSIDQRGAHWQEGVQSDGKPVTMDPTTEGGRRTAFTTLDFAALDDIGWDLGAGTAVPQPPKPATTIPVTVKITHLLQVTNPDDSILFDTTGDYYTVVYINGIKQRDVGEITDDDFNPFEVGNWSFTQDVDASLSSIPVVIQLFDDDDTFRFEDDEMDISPLNDNSGLALTVDLTTGRWSGHVTYPNATARGNGGGDGDAEITFAIELNSKVSSSLVVSGGALTVQGDQFGTDFNDDITFDRTAAGGLKVILNGHVVEYGAGAITAITTNTGGGSNTVRVLNTLVPITINGGGFDRLILADGLPTATYIPDATGLPGFGTLNIGGTLIHFAALEFVSPVSPTVSTVQLARSAVNENGVATLTGAFGDPGSYATHSVRVDWGDGASDVVSLVLGARSFTLTHRFLDDNPTGTASDSYSIAVKVTDNDNLNGTSGTTITVNNVPPVITGSSGSAASSDPGKEGSPVTMSATFTDVGTLDTHTATVDWGDGTVSTAQVTESGGAGSLVAQHSFTSGGIYTVGIRVVDDDTGAVSVTRTAFVTGVGVQVIDGRKTLVVVGSAGDDEVIINKVRDQFLVHASFLASDRFIAEDGIQFIEVIMLGGNDSAIVAANLTLPSIMDGGDGDDFMFAGNGSTVLIGGRGDDQLTGGDARDVLIGGVGADRLVGNGGDDILIAGFTSYDSGSDDDKLANDAILTKLRDEWNSNRSYAQRVTNLKNGSGPILNGSGRLLSEGVTVFDDSADDRLTGSSGVDWFFMDSSRDQVTDRKDTESVE